LLLAAASKAAKPLNLMGSGVLHRRHIDSSPACSGAQEQAAFTFAPGLLHELRGLPRITMEQLFAFVINT
jgi:hypothetical protein